MGFPEAPQKVNGRRTRRKRRLGLCFTLWLAAISFPLVRMLILQKQQQVIDSPGDWLYEAFVPSQMQSQQHNRNHSVAFVFWWDPKEIATLDDAWGCLWNVWVGAEQLRRYHPEVAVGLLLHRDQLDTPHHRNFFTHDDVAMLEEKAGVFVHLCDESMFLPLQVLEWGLRPPQHGSHHSFDRVVLMDATQTFPQDTFTATMLNALHSSVPGGPFQPHILFGYPHPTLNSSRYLIDSRIMVLSPPSSNPVSKIKQVTHVSKRLHNSIEDVELLWTLYSERKSEGFHRLLPNPSWDSENEQSKKSVVVSTALESLVYFWTKYIQHQVTLVWKERNGVQSFEHWENPESVPDGLALRKKKPDDATHHAPWEADGDSDATSSRCPETRDHLTVASPISDLCYFPKNAAPWQFDRPRDWNDKNQLSHSLVHRWYSQLGNLHQFQLQEKGVDLGLDFSVSPHSWNWTGSDEGRQRQRQRVRQSEQLWSTHLGEVSNYSINESKNQYAYAFVLDNRSRETVAGKSSRKQYLGLVYNILVATRIWRRVGSKVDVIVLLAERMGDDIDRQELQLFQALDINVHYLPNPPEPNDSIDTLKIKAFVYYHSLLKYSRVMLLEADTTPLLNTDYWFHLTNAAVHNRNDRSLSSLQPYTVIFHSKKLTKKWNPGLIILPPASNHAKTLQEWITSISSSTVTFDEFTWNWIQMQNHSTVSGVRNEVSHYVENPKAITARVPKGLLPKARLTETWHGPFEPRYGKLWLKKNQNECTKFICDFRHFVDPSRPWNMRFPSGDLRGSSNEGETTKYAEQRRELDQPSNPKSLWFAQLQQLDQELHLEIDFSKWPLAGA